jgi:hypothetical protein
MGVLGSVVAPPTTLVSFCDSKIFDCGSVRFEVVLHELVWHKATFLHKLAHEFQRRPLVPPALDQNIKYFRPRRRPRATDGIVTFAKYSRFPHLFCSALTALTHCFFDMRVETTPRH